jgi:hypothetical protein
MTAFGDTIGYGARVYYGASAPASTEVTEIREVDPPHTTTGLVDNTHLMSTGRIKTDSVLGMKDAGEFSFTFVWDKTQYAALLAVQLAFVNKYWKILYPDGSDVQFQAIITKIEPPKLNFELATCKVTAKLQTDITFTAAA